jgi:hypothetical protein
LGFCREPALLDEAEKWAEDVEINSHDAVQSLKRFGPVPELTRDIESLEQYTSAVMAQLTNLPRDPDYLFPTAEIAATLISLLGASARARRTVWGIKSVDKEDSRNYAAVLLRKLNDVADGALSSLEGERWKLVNERRVLVVGDAGVGKSHLFGDAARAGWPVK